MLIIDKQKYPSLDKVFINELYNFYYVYCLKENNITKFIDFVLSNKEKLNHPKYFLILIETIEFSDMFFNEHYEYCCFINENLLLYEDFLNKLPFTTLIKFTMFMDLFKTYEETKKDIK